MNYLYLQTYFIVVNLFLSGMLPELILDIIGKFIDKKLSDAFHFHGCGLESFQRRRMENDLLQSRHFDEQCEEKSDKISSLLRFLTEFILSLSKDSK